MENAKRRNDPRTARVSNDIQECAARLRKRLTMLDQCSARDRAARREEAMRLRRHVDAVLANVARVERKLRRVSRSRQVSETTIMRAGEALAAAAHAVPLIGVTASVV